MIDKKKPCCPHCRSESLALVGGVILAGTSTTYGKDRGDTDMLSALVTGGAHLTRQLLACKSCEKQFLLTAAEQAADIVKEDYLWETTPAGHAIPIVCPDCGNTKQFLRKKILAIEAIESVSVDGEGQTGTTYHTANPLDEVVTSYLCDVSEDCPGEIAILDVEFNLTAESGG